MASYNSILRHVSMADVKRNTWKLQEQKRIEELCHKEELKILLNKNSPLYSNWRFDLSEDMTTQAMTYATTLPGEGTTDLASAENYTDFVGSTQDGAYITLNANNAPAFDNAEATTLDLGDLSKYTTISVDATQLTSGTQAIRLFGNYGYDPNIFYIMANDLLTTNTFSVPYYAGDRTNFRLQIRSFNEDPGNMATYKVKINFQRRTPITIFVPLDSPEASSFVRTGEFSQLSNEQKIDRLRKMMNASDQYLFNKFGDAFPGTNADQEFADVSQAPSWEQAAEVDYGEDLTPLSKNPYGTELYKTADASIAGELGLLGLTADALIGLVGLGVGGIMAVTNLSRDAAEWLVNKYSPDAGKAVRDAQDYERGTSEQQRQETAEADQKLKDATAELEAANASGDPERIARAEERRSNAVKNRQRVRNKWKTNRQNQKNSYEPEGEMIVEKKLKNPKAFFQDKDIKPEFPENPPPPQIKGLHPDLVTGEKTSQRFNKLDPISAKAMPRTGIKAIDKKVEKAKRLPK